ncbi:IS110 family transposase [Oceanirhabdus sp. W0125-5]|nr:IS110 family transposase [Oceanirhabdus sp. W0125-5]WBW99700.1 IS110 family transposase [Oceanirhabdus sp. W0125-5]
MHKETHTAVIINCWNEILDSITFENKPNAFSKLLKIVHKHSKELIPVFGLEDVGGYGRSLAVYLLEKGYEVKAVNPSLSWAQRMSSPTTKKNDNYDAYCVACVLIAKLYTLPNANPNDLYWTLKQLVGRRNSLVKDLIILQNQLNEQLKHNYPSYKKFFSDIGGKTALAFWEKYPSPQHLKNITVENLTVFLRKASNNACSTRKSLNILELMQSDGNTFRDHQDVRDFIVKSIVKQIRFNKEQMKEIEEELRIIVGKMGFKLHTMPGIDIVTETQLIAEIGDINRFSNADKLARFAGIAPIKFSSAGKGKEQKSRQGNRTLHGVFYFLAIQQVQTAKGSKLPRNPVFYEYYNKKIREGKTKPQALVSVMRRLVNIIYGMLKNRTEYVMPVITNKEAV